MNIYKFVSAEDTINKIALLGRRERDLLEKSAIARKLKNLEVALPENYWIYPKPIPAYTTKVVEEITFKLKLNGSFYSRKMKIAEKLTNIILSLPNSFNEERISLVIDEASGSYLFDYNLFASILLKNRDWLIFRNVDLSGTNVRV